VKIGITDSEYKFDALRLHHVYDCFPQMHDCTSRFAVILPEI
jgi:hypothetical protein